MTTDIENTDFSKLEGAVFIYKVGRETRRGLLVNIDYHIGFTIVNEEDTDNYLWCSRGPSAPTFVNKPGAIDAHKRLFAALVKAVKSGVVQPKVIASIADVHHGSRPSASSCAFN